MARRRAFGSIEKRKSKPGFYVRIRWNGRRIRRAGGPTKAVAQAKLSTAHALLEKGFTIEDVLAEVFGDTAAGIPTFREAATPYLKDAENRKKPSTLAVDTNRIRRICRAPWAGGRLDKIGSDHLARWANDRLAEGVCGSTVNRELALVSALFRWAILMNYVSDNPARRVPRYSEAGTGRETYLTIEECKALVATAEPAFRPVLIAAIYTGMRKGELLALRWKAVDFELGVITVVSESAKSRRSRTIPMSRSLSKALSSLQAGMKVSRADGTDPVFALPDGTHVTKWMTQSRLQAAITKCKAIPPEKKPNVTFHCLRHTAASLLVQNGASIFDVAKILGHSTPAVTMRYAHFAPAAARHAIDRLTEALGDLDPWASQSAGRPISETSP